MFISTIHYTIFLKKSNGKNKKVKQYFQIYGKYCQCKSVHARKYYNRTIKLTEEDHETICTFPCRSSNHRGTASRMQKKQTRANNQTYHNAHDRGNYRTDHNTHDRTDYPSHGAGDNPLFRGSNHAGERNRCSQRR